MSKFLESETEYAPLSTVEGEYVPPPTDRSRWVYPGMRRFPPPGTGPPPDSILVRTGGNALQAVKRQVLEKQMDQQQLIAATVPDGLLPGDTILVSVPGDEEGQQPQGRVVSAFIPEGALPGHTFLVLLPGEEQSEKEPTLVVETAVPVNTSAAVQKGGTSVVSGNDVESTDLRLFERSDARQTETATTAREESAEVELTQQQDSATANQTA